MAVSTFVSRAREALDSRPGDAVLALVLAVFAQLEIWVAGGYRGSPAGNAAFVLVMALALAWRRRAPLSVLALVMAGITVQSLTLGGSETGSLLLIAGLAVYRRPRTARGRLPPRGSRWAERSATTPTTRRSTRSLSGSTRRSSSR